MAKAITKFLCRSEFPVTGFSAEGFCLCGFRGVCPCASPRRETETYPAERQKWAFAAWLGLCLTYIYFFILPGSFLSPSSLQFPTPKHLHTGEERNRGKPG